jgi:hypothetical protein
MDGITISYQKRRCGSQMAVYAAMIDRLDHNIWEELSKLGKWREEIPGDLPFDNGGCMNL